jgi:hypothetical protein
MNVLVLHDEPTGAISPYVIGPGRQLAWCYHDQKRHKGWFHVVP